MNIIQQSFKELYPERELGYETKIKYSRKFKPYNANIKLYRNKLTLNLSREWKTISRDIKIGLIQELLLKLFRGKKETYNIKLYNTFIKKLHLIAPKTKSDPELEESFNKINNKYFYGSIEIPNLTWGSNSTTKLGSYEYASDTITISSVLKSRDDLLDYVMYHELLHKKHQFKSKNGRNYHHTALFRKKEKEFENSGLIEQKLKSLRKNKMFSFFKI
ncbi:MAG: SprT-like domain-containing protein [Nanoarchaeota archaeon]|nr:SprT-like domain-containing protein [Nanoarchaeota archaeon]